MALPMRQKDGVSMRTVRLHNLELTRFPTWLSPFFRIVQRLPLVFEVKSFRSDQDRGRLTGEGGSRWINK